MRVGLGATLLLLTCPWAAAVHSEKPMHEKALFLATLRKALNEELRTPPVQPVAQPLPQNSAAQPIAQPLPQNSAVQPAAQPLRRSLPIAQPVRAAADEEPPIAQPVQPAASADEEQQENEREESEAEAQVKSAREELQNIVSQEGAPATQPSSVALPVAQPLPGNSIAQPVAQPLPGNLAAQPVAQPLPQNSAAQPAAQPLPIAEPVAQPLPQNFALQPAAQPLPIANPVAGNASEANSESEKTAQLAAQISKVARWKDAQATKMMQNAKVELARVQSDANNVEEQKEWYQKLTQKAQQMVQSAAADREAAKQEQKKAEDARAAAEWEAERANGARVQAEQDWQRAQLMQKDAEAAQEQVDKEREELKKEKLEANLEMRKAEEAHSKAERERAELRLEELAFQRFKAQTMGAAQTPPGSVPRSSIAIAGENVRSFGSPSGDSQPQLQKTASQLPVVQALSSSEAASKVVLDAAKEVLGPNQLDAAQQLQFTLAAAVPPQAYAAQQR